MDKIKQIIHSENNGNSGDNKSTIYGYLKLISVLIRVLMIKLILNMY